MSDLSILVLSSFCVFHPSLIIISHLLSSVVTHLKGLERSTPVLLVHDRPRDSQPRFESYINNLVASLHVNRVQKTFPFDQMDDITVHVSTMHAHAAMTLLFGLQHVTTPYVLKMEHDHVFVRHVDIGSLLFDMKHDRLLKIVRFNRRRNVRKACDAGYYADPIHIKTAHELWSDHRSLILNYTRTVCFSDMNHIAHTAHYFENIAIPAARVAPQMVETTIQPRVVHNHSLYGTFIFGSVRAAPTLLHLDASQHRHGEINRSYIRSMRRHPTLKWLKFIPSL